MGNLLAYSGIVTKVRAMQAKLLTDEVFRNGSEKIPGALSEALRDESDQLLSAYCIQPLSEAF